MNDAAQIVAEYPFIAGFFSDMSADHYHKVEAMSTGGAKAIIRSPQHYKLMRDTPKDPTPAMQFGTAVHCGVLQPELELVIKAPEINKRTKDGKAEWDAFLAEHGDHKIILSIDDWERAGNCIAAVRAHPMASKLLDGADVEESLFWIDGKYQVPRKVRWDARKLGGITDLKTTTDASPEAFGRACASFMYHVQEANYREAAEAVLNESPKFFAFVVVESEPPHAVACYHLPPEAVRVGQGWMDVALERYAKALQTGKYPGYPETIEQVPFPRWALRINH